MSQPSAKSNALGIDAPQDAKRDRYRKIPKAERKNNKGWAEGKREDLLRLMVPSFIQARKMGWQAEAQKLLEIQNCYHNHFPYPMQDTDEPVDMVFNMQQTMSTVPPSLSPEETQKRLAYVKDYNKVRGYELLSGKCS